ncbi:hypothetical protein HL653_07615 [Sphingomonas sp. AP4-R1]|uniref:hypothetical protein n=1 Tax=Sphingomonas sp. AP4-R1 TaxID=2735134 RepID=UPI001493C6BE|nr:hypothetical protein [Sphingomonas sp. AP4-R1]QJU56360.1 hypothetical protein HL653_07615 [Sphingomonas sp. AP4-R1]
MRQGLAAETATAGGDPAASQRAPVAGAIRRAWPWLAIGLAAYLVALIVTVPARFILSGDPRWAVAGTLWNGEAVVDGAYRLEWHWAPWRSLASLAFAADVRMTGAGTDLAGAATVSPGGTLLEGFAGSGGGGLLSAFGPRLPFACDAALTITLRQLRIAGTRSEATGEIASDAGSCTAIGGGQPNPVPALITRLLPLPDGTTRIETTPAKGSRVRFFEGRIAAGRLHLALTPAGAAALPFAQGLVIDEAM